jgi:uncharacterized membrane protein YczE
MFLYLDKSVIVLVALCSSRLIGWRPWTTLQVGWHCQSDTPVFTPVILVCMVMTQARLKQERGLYTKRRLYTAVFSVVAAFTARY